MTVCMMTGVLWKLKPPPSQQQPLLPQLPLLPPPQLPPPPRQPQQLALPALNLLQQRKLRRFEFTACYYW